jgi:hypothetical protein
MSVALTPELLAYHAFVKSTLSNGGNIDEDATPAAFLEYQQQLNELRAELQPAADRFRKGEPSAELKIDRLVADVLPAHSPPDKAS